MKPEMCIVLEPIVPIEQIVKWSQEAEELGFEMIGITDGQMIWRDSVVAMTAAALATKRIRIGPWVTNPVTRHPAVTANVTCTLAEVSKGRAFLGIGNGDDAVKTIGAPEAKMDDLARDVQLIRSLMEGQPVTGPNGKWSISTARKEHVDIYWAGANPKSLEYGARYTDGLIVSGFVDEGWLADANSYIEKGRDGKELDVFFNSAVSIAEDGAYARQTAKPYVAKGFTYLSSAKIAGWSREQMEELRKSYQYYHHFRNENPAAKLVSDEMVPKKSISGTPEQCAELMRIVMDSGINKFALMPMGDVSSVMQFLAKRVLPLLA